MNQHRVGILLQFVHCAFFLAASHIFSIYPMKLLPHQRYLMTCNRMEHEQDRKKPDEDAIVEDANEAAAI